MIKMDKNFRPGHHYITPKHYTNIQVHIYSKGFIVFQIEISLTTNTTAAVFQHLLLNGKINIELK